MIPEGEGLRQRKAQGFTEAGVVRHLTLHPLTLHPLPFTAGHG
jgi:hypothetical protein